MEIEFMSLVNWSELPVRTKRSRKRLYSVLAEEFGLESWIGLDVNIKRSKANLYNFLASELGLVGFDELPVECRRSTRLMYLFIKENASGGGSSSDTLTVTVSDGTDIITGASVTIDDTTVVTGDDGTASFTLEYGDYACTVTCNGYEDTTETLSFRSNHKNFTITLTESGGGGTGYNIPLILYGSYSQYPPVGVVGATVKVSTIDHTTIVEGTTDNTGTIICPNVELDPAHYILDVYYEDKHYAYNGYNAQGVASDDYYLWFYDDWETNPQSIHLESMVLQND